MSEADLVTELVPIQERTARSVFVVPEEEIFPKTSKINHSTTLFIRDADQLQSFLDEKSGRLNINAPNARNSVLTRLILSATIKIAPVEVDLGRAIFTPNLSRTLEAFDQYVIYENGIDAPQFAELFQLFLATPAHRRPCVLLISNKNGSNLIEKLRYSEDSIEFVDIKTGANRMIDVTRKIPADKLDYIDLYCRGVYRPTARADVLSLENHNARAVDQVKSLMSNVLRYQARLMTEERHHVEPDIDTTLVELAGETEALNDGQRDHWLRLKCYLLLQKTYCSEERQPLEKAMAIASVLGNDFDNALCLRFAHLLGQEPALEMHMLQKAEEVFRKNHCLELALYAANNRHTAAFSSIDNPNRSFLDLVREIEAVVPHLHRKHDIKYNSGVEALFCNRFDEAISVFRAIDNSDARALIKCSAVLSGLIADCQNGKAITAPSIIQFLNSLSGTVDKSNEWHRTNLALNGLVLASNNGLNWKLIYENFRDLVNIRSQMDVRDIYNENELLASHLGLTAMPKPIDIGGSFGRFYRQTNLLVPYYFIWS